MKQRIHHLAQLLALGFSTFVLVGCSGSGNVASVNGNVSLDGTPLPGAYVVFTPTVPGGQASAITDELGNYQLQYTREIRGAEIGEHTVRITTFEGGNPDADSPRPPTPEKLPSIYNSATELKASVKAGKNKVDFSLYSSKGKPPRR
ncbi:MAG: carboxypeptidase regulatory-like domain-containing protein [Planctomycetales bacterium]|nr:carboxypeptidase regulatory-like domain-containing protein [Planctomycetales bacterium]